VPDREIAARLAGLRRFGVDLERRLRATIGPRPIPRPTGGRRSRAGERRSRKSFRSIRSSCAPSNSRSRLDPTATMTGSRRHSGSLPRSATGSTRRSRAWTSRR